jgi:hypothetical protein
MVALNEAYAKLAALSEERARRVVELIEDLAALEAREDAEDLADALQAKAEFGDEGISLEEWKKEIGL